MKHIVRTWTCWIRTEHTEFCKAYVEDAKLAQMRASPGNLEAKTLYRDLGDGTTEVVFLSLWDSMESVRLFAGAEASRPTGQDNRSEDHMTVDRETVVRHHEVEAERVGNLMDWY
jgi:heme-degrading monooxygenase HmoA